MTTPTLTREDTGEFLPVRVADDTPPLLAALQAEREGKPVATWAEFDEGLTELRRRLIDGLGEADAVLSAGQSEPEPEPPSFPDAVMPADDEVVFYVDFNRQARHGLVKTVRHHGTKWVNVGQRVRAVDPHEHDMAYDAIVDTIEGDVVYLRVQWTAEAYMAAEDPDPRPGRWVNVAEDDLLPARIVRVGRNPLEQAYAEREARGWTPDPADYEPRPADHGPVDRWLARTEQRLRQWWADKQAQRDERMGVAE